MGKELLLIIHKEFMKGSGKMIKEMEWDMNDLQMEINMKDSIEMEKLKVLGGTRGQIMSTMMDNGQREINKDMELGKAAKMNNIVDNGIQISLMGLGNMCGEMGMYMKENGKHV